MQSTASTVSALRTLITEVITEAARVAPPPELTALVGKLPMKIERTERGSWIASAKFSEKKRAEQGKMGRAWERITASLSKKPWTRVAAERDGWNGQTDTGGNFAGGRLEFRNSASGLHVSLRDSVSFKTGSKEWTIAAWQPAK